jgi:hypothetical protein
MKNSLPPSKGKEPDPEVSVDLARLTTPPHSPDGSLQTAGRPNQGIGAMQAAFPREFGLAVNHAPISSPDAFRNMAHTLIVGNVGERAMSLCDRMAIEMSQYVKIYPVGSPWRQQAEGTDRP